MVAEISPCISMFSKTKYANPKNKDKAIFSPNSLRSMGETGLTCLNNFAKLQSNRLTTKQGSSTAHTFLPGEKKIYIIYP